MSAQDVRPAPPARSGAATALGWILTIGLNVVAPIITYNTLVDDHGWSEFSALLLSSAWPVLDSAISLAWRRKLDEFAVVTLVFLVITAVVSLVGDHSARTLLVKDSGVTGLFGLLCLATLLAPRPLMFYFGRKFATDGTRRAPPGGTACGSTRAPHQHAHHDPGLGVAYVIEALARIALAYTLDTKTMVTLSPIMLYGVLGALGLWTAMYGKRSQAEGERRAAEAKAAAEAEAEAAAAGS
ncbi:VC0807 family protein [Streptomyces sp. MS1.HAVA.3]|uniref:VC0807 family protein n=1 Tax=Streptomyces caledonius TaxID=3134107 RepID=A0ABU8U976_9ACTN